MANLYVAIATVNTVTAHKEIVRWLTPVEYEAEYYMEDLENARKLRHPGTCEWIRTQPNFKSWSESTAPSNDSLLWIHAIPGAGKTILSSFMIDHPGFWPSSKVFYFLFRSTDIDKNSTIAAARSLLYQLYKNRRSADTALVDDIEAHLNESGQNRAKNYTIIWNLFCTYAINVTNLIIVIDALDECIEPGIFIRDLRKLSKDSAIQVVVTSRREKELVENLRDWMPIEMGSKEVAADIAAFLEHKVSTSSKLSHPLVRSSVLKLLLSRSKGMFLWVALMIKDLKSKVSVFEIQDALLALPEGLDRMYERILRRLDTSLQSSPKELCLRVLRWVVCATRPLKMQELEEALKLEYTDHGRFFGFDQAFLFTERDIELACGSLLTIRSGTVQLIHLSAQEFLQSPSIRLGIDKVLHPYLVDIPTTSLQITSQCVSYLLSRYSPAKKLPADDQQVHRFDQIQDFDAVALKKGFPLLDYACSNWVRHLVNVIDVPSDENNKPMRRFVESQCCLMWIEVCFILDPGCLVRLRADLDELVNWANSSSAGLEPSQSPQSEFIHMMREWARDIQKFLLDYRVILQERPAEVHFIDPARIFESRPSFRPQVNYERHIVLNDPELRQDLSPISEKYRLQQSSSNDEISFFHRDPHRDVFYFIDEFSSNPCIFVQECSTGRRLPPITDPELDEAEDGEFYTVRGACMSPDGHYLAVCFCDYRSDHTNLENDRELIHIAVWAIAETFNFRLGHRTSTWAKKRFSYTIVCPIFVDSLRAVTFAVDGSLCCPAGQVSFSTGEVRPLSTEKLGKWLESSWLEDGKSLIMIRHDKLVQFTREGEILRSLTLSGRARSLLCYSSSGEFVVYSASEGNYLGKLAEDMRETVNLQNVHTGITHELGSADGRFYRFVHFDRDKLLGMVIYSEGVCEKTKIFVWNGIPSQPYLWATMDFANEVFAHFLDEHSYLLYVVGPCHIWGRISLKTSALMIEDLHIADQTQINPSHVESRVSCNGKKLAILKFWKLRCAANEPCLYSLTTKMNRLMYSTRANIRVLDLNRPKECLLSSSLDLLTDDIDERRILFSPDLELLVVNTSLYQLNCSDQVNSLVPITLPFLIDSKTSFFSSCHNFIAICSPFPRKDDPIPVTLHVYHVSLPDGEITEVDISLRRLEQFTGVKLAGIKINFHPTEPKLGIAYWSNTVGGIYHEETNKPLLLIKCLVLDLRSLILENILPSSPEEIPLMSKSPNGRTPRNWCYTNPFFLGAGNLFFSFSDCAHYLMVDNWSNERCVFSLRDNRTESNARCNRPLIISQTGKLQNCFFIAEDVSFVPYIDISIENSVEHEADDEIKHEINVEKKAEADEKTHKKVKSESKILTTIPAHLCDAIFTLLLGENDDSNVRVVFHSHTLGPAIQPEIKYLNFTWKDFISTFNRDFSKKLPALRKPP